MNINLETELRSLNNEAAQQSLLNEVNRMLEELDRHDDDIYRALGVSKGVPKGTTQTDLQWMKNFPSKDIFTFEQIHQIAKRYDLYLRGSRRFKGAVPASAIQALKEKMPNTDYHQQRFFILAPRNQFEKPAPVDPILFCHLTGDFYLFIAKWGNDMTQWRRVVAIARSVVSVSLFVIGGLAVLGGMIIPWFFGSGWFFLIMGGGILIMTGMPLYDMMYPDNWAQE